MLRSIAVLFLLFQGAVPGSAGPKILIGTWFGSYVCGQGMTGLTLSIVTQTGSDFDGFFHFYPTASNPAPKEGCFSVKGHIEDSDKVSIVARNWISQPSGYDTVDLNGTLDILGGHMAGAVSVPHQAVHSCKDFEIEWGHPKPQLAFACRGTLPQSALRTAAPR